MTDFAALFHRLLDRLEGAHGQDAELDEMRGMLPRRQDEAVEQDGPDGAARPEAPAGPPPHPDLPAGPAITGGLGLTNEEHLASLGPSSGAALPHEADGAALEGQEAVPATAPAKEAAHEPPAPASEPLHAEDGSVIQAEDGSPVVVQHEEAGE